MRIDEILAYGAMRYCGRALEAAPTVDPGSIHGTSWLLLDAMEAYEAASYNYHRIKSDADIEREADAVFGF